jgi:hypothetical protein
MHGHTHIVSRRKASETVERTSTDITTRVMIAHTVATSLGNHRHPLFFGPMRIRKPLRGAMIFDVRRKGLLQLLEIRLALRGS